MSDPVSNPNVVNLSISTPNQNPSALIPYSGLSDTSIQAKFSMEIDQNSMVAIAVSAVEAKIRDRIADLRTRLASDERTLAFTENEQREARNAFSERCRTTATAHEALRLALIPFDKDASITTSDTTFNEKTRRFSCEVTVKLGDGRSIARTVVTDDVPATYLTSLRVSENLRTQIEQLKSEILSTRAALANMSTMERQARADIARHVASRTETGADLVKAIEASVNIDNIVDRLRV